MHVDQPQHASAIKYVGKKKLYTDTNRYRSTERHRERERSRRTLHACTSYAPTWRPHIEHCRHIGDATQRRTNTDAAVVQQMAMVYILLVKMLKLLCGQHIWRFTTTAAANTNIIATTTSSSTAAAAASATANATGRCRCGHKCSGCRCNRCGRTVFGLVLSRRRIRSSSLLLLLVVLMAGQ